MLENISIGYFTAPSMLPQNVLENIKDKVSHLYTRMALTVANTTKIANGESQQVGLITPDSVDEGFQRYLDNYFNIKLINFTYHDISHYQTFKDKIEILKEKGVHNVNFISYTNDLSPQIVTILKNRIEFAQRLDFSISVQDVSTDKIKNKTELPADKANNKLLFSSFCTKEGIRTMPSRTIVNIEYSKNQDGKVDKNSTIVNLNDIKREIEDILKATKNGVVIQFPKSGGGFGTFFVHNNFTNSRYVDVNAFIASLNCYTISALPKI